MNTRNRHNRKVVDQEFVCIVLTARLTGHVTLSALPAVYERNETLPYTYTYVSAGPSLEGAIRLSQPHCSILIKAFGTQLY